MPFVLKAFDCRSRGSAFVYFSSEIIKEGCGKVIERGNYKQLKEEIINYNREEWDRNLIVSNRKYFSEKRMAEEYYNLYKEMLNNESEM